MMKIKLVTIYLFIILLFINVLYAQSNTNQVKQSKLDQVAPLAVDNLFVAFMKQTRISGGLNFLGSVGPIAKLVPFGVGLDINWDFTLNKGKKVIWRTSYEFNQIGLSKTAFLQAHSIFFGPSYSFFHLPKNWGQIYIALVPGIAIYKFHRAGTGSQERLVFNGHDVTFHLQATIGHEIYFSKELFSIKSATFFFYYLTVNYLFDKSILYVNLGLSFGLGYNFGRTYKALL